MSEPNTVYGSQPDAKQLQVQLTPFPRAKVLAQTLRCNCDFDNWEPERNPYTGHTHVCRIHKAAIAKAEGRSL